MAGLEMSNKMKQHELIRIRTKSIIYNDKKKYLGGEEGAMTPAKYS